MVIKICAYTKCGKEFIVNEFIVKHNINKKYCSGICGEKSYLERNRERLRIKQITKNKQWYSKSENKERKKIYNKQWHSNPENREKHKAYMLNYYFKNKDNWNIRSLHNKNRDYYLKKFNHQCYKCSSTQNFELHHTKYENIPKSEYVFLYCRPCHRQLHRELRGKL